MTHSFYRTYRPKALRDVVGQETTVTILQNAARTNRIGHAYLFYGGRGSGKTTMARIVAKLLNCTRRQEDAVFAQEAEPCNNCSICVEIDAGNSLDVIEIDAASHRGIDEIRDLKEGVTSAPMKNKYKVYIVDEAHMLTTAAFNALLKTLEEPPEHGVLILATTDYEKIPATIVSRTQRLAFRKLSNSHIVSKLKIIAKKEHIQANDDALELIASCSGGSLRDAESLFDQIATFSDQVVDIPSVEQVTGRTGLQKVHALAQCIAEGNAAEAVKKIKDIEDDGVNLSQFAKDLIHYLRKILTVKVNPKLATLLADELSPDELLSLETLAQKTNQDFLVVLLKNLIVAYSQMRYSPHGIIPLEIAIIETMEQTKTK